MIIVDPELCRLITKTEIEKYIFERARNRFCDKNLPFSNNK